MTFVRTVSFLEIITAFSLWISANDMEMKRFRLGVAAPIGTSGHCPFILNVHAILLSRCGQMICRSTVFLIFHIFPINIHEVGFQKKKFTISQQWLSAWLPVRCGFVIGSSSRRIIPRSVNKRWRPPPPPSRCHPSAESFSTFPFFSQRGAFVSSFILISWTWWVY